MGAVPQRHRGHRERRPDILPDAKTDKRAKFWIVEADGHWPLRFNCWQSAIAKARDYTHSGVYPVTVTRDDGECVGVWDRTGRVE